MFVVVIYFGDWLGRIGELEFWFLLGDEVEGIVDYKFLVLLLRLGEDRWELIGFSEF